jgi:hypothetical protein
VINHSKNEICHSRSISELNPSSQRVFVSVCDPPRMFGSTDGNRVSRQARSASLGSKRKRDSRRPPNPRGRGSAGVKERAEGAAQQEAIRKVHVSSDVHYASHASPIPHSGPSLEIWSWDVLSAARPLRARMIDSDGKCREPPSGVDSRLSEPACGRRSIGSRGRSRVRKRCGGASQAIAKQGRTRPARAQRVGADLDSRRP